MIQPQELRIENYVEYNGEIIKLDGSLLCCYIQNELEFPLNPIPLTEEILLKFGFEKKGDFWFVKSGIKIENRNNGFSYFRYLNENFEIVKPTRQEALAEAIKKANEIYNEKYSISQ